MVCSYREEEKKNIRKSKIESKDKKLGKVKPKKNYTKQ